MVISAGDIGERGAAVWTSLDVGVGSGRIALSVHATSFRIAAGWAILDLGPSTRPYAVVGLNPVAEHEHIVQTIETAPAVPTFAGVESPRCCAQVVDLNGLLLLYGCRVVRGFLAPCKAKNGRSS